MTKGVWRTINGRPIFLKNREAAGVTTKKEPDGRYRATVEVGGKKISRLGKTEAKAIANVQRVAGKKAGTTIPNPKKPPKTKPVPTPTPTEGKATQLPNGKWSATVRGVTGTGRTGAAAIRNATRKADKVTKVPRPSNSPSGASDSSLANKLKISSISSRIGSKLNKTLEILSKKVTAKLTATCTVNDSLGGRRSLGQYVRSGNRYTGDIDSREIRLNVKARRYGESTLGKLGAIDRWGVSSTVEDTFRHEYGHHVWYSNPNLDQREWRELHRDEYNMYVSTYAGTNPEELYAETFAAYTHPDYKKGMLPKKLEDAIERSIK